MKHALAIVFAAFTVISLPAWADPDKNESDHYWEGPPSWSSSFEAGREARKYYEEQEREARKHHEELWRERRKHREEMERESLKYYEELERESLKHALELEREGGGRYLYRIGFAL